MLKLFVCALAVISFRATPAFAVDNSNSYPHPPPRPRSFILRCESNHYRYHSCYVNPRIYRVSLIRRWSAAPCIPNRTFGAQTHAVWVNLGCSADFRVEYYR